MALGQIATQMETDAVSDDAIVHKWQVFHDIREARLAIGASAGALSVLNALLSFHLDTAFHGDSALIVWPSNAQLQDRSYGISEATLRRHLANLVACGLIIRRDSPNGKRFARKNAAGEVDQAFGFDLTPLVARAVEFKSAATSIRADKEAFRLAKERLTLTRRDVVVLIETGINEGVPGNWAALQARYARIIGRLPRQPMLAVIEDFVGQLEALRVEVRKLLTSFVISINLSGNDAQNERHIQNSKPDSTSESEHGFRNKEEEGGSAFDQTNVRILPERELPLGIVLDACESARFLVKGGVSNWRDFLDIAEAARPILGISPDAWSEARIAMGERQAAIVVAAMYERADEIRSAGGYLRNLTERARGGKFSVSPMVMALVRAKLDAAKARGEKADDLIGKVETLDRVGRVGDRIEVSSSLLKSLETKLNSND